MSDYIQNPYDGDKWEKIIDDCYRLRHQCDGYTKIHANFGGDAGIEGYIHIGIAYQCYCPEKQYTDNELWEKQRDKINKDINKLISNGDRLKAFGVENIKEWHFVTPEHRDSRLVTYSVKKAKEILEAKKNNNLDYIDDKFKILIKTGNDFIDEIRKLNCLGKLKFNISLNNTREPDWSKCSSEKVQNIERKLKAIINPDKDETRLKLYNKMVQFIGGYYIHGLEVLDEIKKSDIMSYEKIYELNNMYKKEVEYRCTMNMDSSTNNVLFNTIKEEFHKELKSELGELYDDPSIYELTWDLLSSWIADCPMDFI
ncbi:hypothetical protein EXM69_16120 [Clostridium botulinum]|uniref:Uncharacterized protein n=1 Tax=Clostridium botulinum TaxID=1491 RepID=A0A846I1B9_CLOBO|nr:hypothetical protein [Clostridium botulinum]